MTSDWRGDARGAKPKRSASYRGMDICIISTAQHASPNVIHINEPVRAQVIRSSVAVTRKPLSASSAFMPVKKESFAPTGLPVRGSMIPFGAGATRVMGLSIPFQRPLPPLIYEADSKNAKEHHHRPETVEPDLAKDDRPREQEADLEVENDKKNGDEIKPNIKLHARVVKSVESALVRGEFFRIRLLVGDDEGGDQKRKTDAERDSYEDDEGQIVHQQCAHRRPQACSPALLDCTL